MTFVKICGLSTREHVEAAVNAGASMIGFVFAPSRREISAEQAAELAQFIPSNVKKVGVFVNAAAQTIQQIFKQVPLDYVQYHGDETNDFIAQIRLPSIKAFAIRTNEDIMRAANYTVDFYLFDTPGTTYRGGSGQTFDWSLLAETNIPKHKIIVAGGLNPSNVEQAIRIIEPAVVDVSSGVEQSGIKDTQLIEQFIAAAKGAIV